ncbi:TPA: hypothetical protein GRI77_19690 [Vibrio parahaemolyticus]|nr:hypothetical protein [Vibrio parahaemolyticus]
MRTNSGISNSHLFSGVDIVVYTEGGSVGYSLEDVESGKFNKQSVDIKFWSGLFKAANFNKKVVFKALGSKTSSKSIRDKIISGEVSNVAIALDRDMDFILANPEISPFVLYTKGYSWENDVYTEQNTLDQIDSMLMEQIIPDEILGEVSNAYQDFNKLGHRLIQLEVIYRSNNHSFITKINGQRFFNSRLSPKINREQVVRFISEKKNSVENRPLICNVNYKNVCPKMNVYGKLLACLSINVISYVCKKYTSHRALPNPLLESNMMERYIQMQKYSCDAYYKEIIDALDAA